MKLPSTLDYPILVIADLHGQRQELDRLVRELERLKEWPRCALMFLGDFVDRGPDVRGTISRVMELLSRPPGGSAVMGNHDLALVRAARLDDGPESTYWIRRYHEAYDHQATFRSYLGPIPNGNGNGNGRAWPESLLKLRDAMPQTHRDFLAGLPWVVEATEHLFLHCGLSNELEATAEEQLQFLRQKRWDRAELRPRPDTQTDLQWEADYPVWIGAARALSRNPLPFPGKVQVSGHVHVDEPDHNAVRIRMDTSGGFGKLTACLLSGHGEPPRFLA